MPLTPTLPKPLAFLPLFDRFIADSLKGKRLQPNGKKISPNSIRNYTHTRRLLQNFCLHKEFDLRIFPAKRMNKRWVSKEKLYWQRFYRSFTDYLYNDLGHFDNYVGQNIKNIRAFFAYLNKELMMDVGEFYKSFYVRKEEIAIFPLSPEELNFLIYDKIFEQSLTARMRTVKDFFVFGCTVALRFSDLSALKRTNLRSANGHTYLCVRSIKTSVDTMVKLPGYAIEILQRYCRQRWLLPRFSKSSLNEHIKTLLELAGMDQPVSKVRERRGVAVEIKQITGNKAQSMRFCDVASTHTMRRTAITTMLCLGMQEQVVRKISGHSANSKEFYRYVSWAQSYQDKETEMVFEKLSLLQGN